MLLNSTLTPAFILTEGKCSQCFCYTAFADIVTRLPFNVEGIDNKLTASIFCFETKFKKQESKSK